MLGSPLIMHRMPSQFVLLINSFNSVLIFIMTTLSLLTTFYLHIGKNKMVNVLYVCEFRTERIYLTNKCPILSIEKVWDKCIIKSKDRGCIMKHTVTTYNTKKLLATSLKAAMRQKPFSKITVSEIIAICGVNRKTFYYHFEDIYALLKWMFEEEALEVVKHFDLLVNYEDAIRFVMRYVDENDYIISCAYDSIGREEMKRFFYADFVGVVASVIDSAEKNLNKSIDSDFKTYVAKFYTEALAGMLIDWAKERDKHDREKVVGYLTSIIGFALKSMELYDK